LFQRVFFHGQFLLKPQRSRQQLLVAEVQVHLVSFTPIAIKHMEGAVATVVAALVQRYPTTM
jgi:hypothetical protein